MAAAGADSGQRYYRWNDAVADVVYANASAGRPTFLDLEDNVLATIRDLAEPDATDPAGALVEAVRSNLQLDAGPSPFLGWYLKHLRWWTLTDMLDPPPTLGLLAVLSLAAENMRHAEGKSANNFYGRLSELLNLTPEQEKWFTDAYRKNPDGSPVSERLWGSLNSWLERLEGNRGLPTAYADGHAHVGLPLSQALVRETDRDKFSELFASYGLPPHCSLPASEMEELIAEWMSRATCPMSATLTRLWKRDGSTRERIVDVARLTLESWDGSDTEGADDRTRRQVDSVRVRALLRQFPVRQLEISLVIAAHTDAAVESVELVASDGEQVGCLDLVPAASGWITLADPGDIDASSFLNGKTELRRENEATLRRRPRRLIPLCRNDLLQAFVESERVNLGEDALLLARSEIASNVADALVASARPGFTRLDSISGLPAGWTLFDGVQILSPMPPEVTRTQLVDLNVLQPLARSQVVFQGGLRLPGNIPKWSTALPPELRVTSEAGSLLSARLSCVRPLTAPVPPDREVSTDQPVLIWDLADEELPDGDYEMAVTEDGHLVGRPAVLRLRSADNPAVVIDADRLPLAHDPLTPSSAFTAARSDPVHGFRCVPNGTAAVEELPPPVTYTPRWYGARQAKRTRSGAPHSLHVPSPEEGSCMLTGRHHMLIETAQGGDSSVEGTCKTCGLVKRYPTRGRKKRSSNPASSANLAPRIAVSAIEHVKALPPIDWTVGFDALCHLGSGPISALEGVAMQMEATGLFGDTFARRLEMLGHVEVERDPLSLVSRTWEVVDPVLAGLPDERVVLIGFRSDRMLVAVEDAAWDLRVELKIDKRLDAPPRLILPTSDPTVVERVIRSIEAATGRSARHVPQAAERLAAELPPLSEALSALPITSTTAARTVERWDPVTARFEEARDAGRPGAYRLKGFTRSYIYRRPSDIGAMRGLVGDARIVKFAAALDAGMSLIGYDSGAEVLYVPLGADLPGLYGRSAVLASGRPPRENVEERLLEYRNVPPTLAARLCDLLMS
jgi:hypothetical protein